MAGEGLNLRLWGLGVQGFGAGSTILYRVKGFRVHVKRAYRHMD